MKPYALLIGLVLALNACAAKQPVLSEKDSKWITGTHVEVVVPNKQLCAEIVHSNVGAASGAFMFGAIGGLVAGAVDASIDASHMKDAEKFVAPLRPYLAEVDFPSEMSKAVAGELGQLDKLKFHDVATTDKMSKHEALKQLQASGDNAVLLVESGYSILPNFRAIKVTAKIHLLLDKEGGKDALSTEVTYTSELLPETTPEKLAATWSANDGERLKAEVHKGITMAAGMIRQRLEYAGETDTTKLASNAGDNSNTSVQ